MIKLRELEWPDDESLVLGLDTSFATNRILELEAAPRSFALREVTVDRLVEKSYPLDGQLESIAACTWTRLATIDDIAVGIVAVDVTAWNNRAEIEHLYVARSARNMGVGRMLIEAACSEALRLGVRCVVVETQTLNYPAIRFYERSGFTLCGLDVTLYDVSTVQRGEVAVYLARPVP